MRKLLTVTKLLILILLGLLPYQAHAQQILNTSNNPIKEADFAPDHFIVKYKNNTLAPLDATTAASADQGDEVPIKHFKGTKSIDQLHQKHHIKGMRKAFRKHKRGPLTAKQTAIVDDFEKQDVYLLNLNTKDKNAIKQAVVDFQHDPNVEYAQPDYIATVNFTPNDPYFQTKGSWGQTYDDLWALKKINAPQAWDIKQGQGVIVAVVDTGVDYNHPDIAANMVPGWNFVNNTNNPMDGNGHGTHVAGTIAAIGNNSLGIVGVAPQAKIMPVKGLDDTGTGNFSTLANAIVYAAQNGAKVINNSWGCGGPCPSNYIIEDAVRQASNWGSVVVFAAGNSHENVANYSPQNMTDHKPLVVAASGADNTLAIFSNYGDLVDVTAPGVDILSLKTSICAMCRAKDIVGTQYLKISGTSMAAPHVSGLAALILSNNPTFTNEDIKASVKYYATAMLNLSGNGLINAANSISVHSIPIISIDSPSTLIIPTTPTIPIKGTANASANFKSYDLSYSTYSAPTTWITIASSSIPVNSNVLGQWNISNLKSDMYHIRLQIWTTDNSSPAIYNKLFTIYDKNIIQIASDTNISSLAINGNTIVWTTNDPYSSQAFIYNLTSKQRIQIQTKYPPNFVTNHAIYINNGFIIVDESIPSLGAGVVNIGIYDLSGNLISYLDDLGNSNNLAYPLWTSTNRSPIATVNNGHTIINFLEASFLDMKMLSYSYDYDLNAKTLSKLVEASSSWGGSFLSNDNNLYYFKPVLDTTNPNINQYYNLITYNLTSKNIISYPSQYSKNEILEGIFNGNLITSYRSPDYPFTGTKRIHNINKLAPNDVIREDIYDTTLRNIPPLVAYQSTKIFAWEYSSLDQNKIQIENITGELINTLGISPYLKRAIAINDQQIVWADDLGVFSYAFPSPIFQSTNSANVLAGKSLNIPIKATDASGSKLTLSVAGTGPADLNAYMPGAVFKDNGDGTGNLTWAVPANLPSKDYNLNFTATNAYGLSSSQLVTINLTASTVIGNIDAVTANTDGSYAVSGWACSTGQDASISVKLKLGGVSLNVEYLAASGTANLGSDSIIKNACMATGNTYRFSLTMNATDVKNYSGLPLKVYGVSAINGSETAISNPAGFTVPGVRDTQLPSAPSNLTAKVISPGNISLTWTASTDNIKVERYLIWRNNQLIYISTATSLNDIGLVPNTSYTYSVTAMDTAGNSSLHSNTVTATTFNCCSTGDITYWNLDGTLNIADRGYFPKGQGLAGWRLAATVDLNGDGKKDFIWQNTSTGDITYWYMNGMNFISGDYFPQGHQNGGLASWRLVTAADLNGDGKADLIWQNTSTGDITYWYMNGINLISGDYFPQGHQNGGLANWRLVTAADLNGDGKADLVWQVKSTGDIAYWYMNGINLISNGFFPQGQQNGGLAPWKLVTATDLNGDGKADLVWQVISSGDIGYWYMNGINQISNSFFPQGQQNGGLAPWNLAAMTDLNGDGKPDIVWQYK